MVKTFRKIGSPADKQTMLFKEKYDYIYLRNMML